jgi:hypothetical protein
MAGRMSASAEHSASRQQALLDRRNFLTTRVRTSTVTFARPFFLHKINRELPAGSYPLETDEEVLEGVSTATYRRVEIRLFVPRIEGLSEAEMWVLGPQDLDTVLARDREPSAGKPAAPDLTERRAAFERSMGQAASKRRGKGNAPLYGVSVGILALLFATWIAHQLAPASQQAPAVQILVTG